MYCPSALAAAPKEMKTNEKPRMKNTEAVSTRRLAMAAAAAVAPVPCISSRLRPEM